MASTRNINTKSDYCIRQQSYNNSEKYALYPLKRTAYKSAEPEFGIFVGYMPSNQLSRNPVDIESALFGINSTNLVEPQKPVVPLLKKLPEVKYYDKIPIIMHEDHSNILLKNQRPFPISS